MKFDSRLILVAGAAVKQAVEEDYARSLIAVILTVTLAAALYKWQYVPPELMTVWSLVIGYYFGRGVSNAGQ